MANDLSFLSEYKDRKILIAPLNWGLGHATRCAPIIKFLNLHNEVILASDGLALEWLQREFYGLQSRSLPSYNISYSSKPMWINMILQAPTFVRTLMNEKAQIKKLVEKLEVDLIISDHRLGVRSDNIESILLAHQIRILHPNNVTGNLATHLHKQLINKFDAVWIPDNQRGEEGALSGQLSSSYIVPPKTFVGPLTRFLKKPQTKKDVDVAVILSGPEPARTVLELQLMDLLSKMNLNQLIFVRGSNSQRSFKNEPSYPYKMVDFANSANLEVILSSAQLVICRSGYSSIMDLVELEQRALLIPTPNQPEQQYLSAKHGATDLFKNVKQIDLTSDIISDALIWARHASK